MKKRKTNPMQYPVNLLKPIGKVLNQQLSRLKKRRRDIAKDDPFKNVDRITDNAAPDADAEEQYGHARTTAIKDQLDRKIIQTRRAMARIKVGNYGICEGCSQMINTDRLIVKPEATLCVKCESKQETEK